MQNKPFLFGVGSDMYGHHLCISLPTPGRRLAVMDTSLSRSALEQRPIVHERNHELTLPHSIQSTSSDLIRRDVVAVIIPARNESEQILSTLDSLKNQTRKPDAIIVVANNCTDHGRTAGLARAIAGVTVYEMDNNPFLKAGALNYGLTNLMTDGKVPEYVVTIDADTILASDFIKNSVHVLACEPGVGVVSAVCDGKKKLGTTPFQKVLATAQRAEYARASFTRVRTNIHTMSGAGAMLRAEAILDVLADRPTLFAETTDNLVEDFELTLELKRHGWKCVNNYYCRAETDLMLSITSLMKQRYRWVHGTINELRRRGWKRETRGSIMTMWYALLSIPVFHLWPLLFLYHVVAESPVIQDFWFLTLVMAFQAISVRRLGWKTMLFSALLLPDLVFGLLRHAWILKSLFKSYAPALRAAPQRETAVSW